MKKPMTIRRFVALLAFCASALVPLFTRAALSPYVVWEGDFGTMTNHCNMVNYHGNSTEDGVLTIDQSVGAVFELGNGVLNNCTFILKCSGLNLASSNKQYLLSLHQNILGGGNGDASYNKVGVSLAPNNAGVYGIWENAYYTANTTTTAPLSSGDTTLCVNIQVNGGVWVWEVTTELDGSKSLTPVYKCTTLKSSDTNYKGFTLGGIYEKSSSTLSPATGWKIEKLAVFNSTLTEAQMLAYAFPSDYAESFKSVLSLNFGASSDTRKVTSGTDPGAVVADSNWYNLSSQNGTDIKVGSATVTYSCKNLHGNDKQCYPYLRGYLDDGNTGASIKVSGLSGSRYDVVVYCSSDNASGWSYKTVNSKNYTWSDTDCCAIEGTANWGDNNSDYFGNGLGRHALLIKDVEPQDGAIELLSIRPDTSSVANRGCVSAVQICEHKSDKVYTAEIKSDVDWTKIVWTPAKPDTGFEASAELIINASGSPTLTFDENVSLKSWLTVNGNLTMAAANSLYEDGCWEKSIAQFGKMAGSGITVPSKVRTGFYGKYSLSSTAVILRAQNKEVISINIAGGDGGGEDGTASPTENLVTSTTEYYGIAPTLGSSWNNIDGQFQGADGTTRTISIAKPNAYDGKDVINRETMSLSATGKNTYQAGSIANPFLRGYLDDGEGVTVKVHGIPYTKYDVIVYATSDNSAYQLNPITINGTEYTYSGGATVPGSTAWGTALYSTPEIGKNALRVDDCTGEMLTITSKRVTGRGTLCAVQVICRGDVVLKHDYTTTLKESKQFSEITWNEGTFSAGTLTTASITNNTTTPLTVTMDDPSVTMMKLAVAGSGSTTLLASSDLVNVSTYDFSGLTGSVTVNIPVSRLAMSASGSVTYVNGAGSAESSAEVTFSSGAAATLSGSAAYYLGGTFPGDETAYSLHFAGITAYCNDWAGLGVGNGTVTIDGASVVNSERLILSQGKNGLTSVLTVGGTSKINVSGTTSSDANTCSIMFGHYNGPSTFNLNDSAAFTAQSDVLVGKTGNDHTINLNGGVFTAPGIKLSANATGNNRLNLNGGKLVLGSTGICSYSTGTSMQVQVNEDSEIDSSAKLSITQSLLVGIDKTLTLDATKGDITLSGNIVNNGTIKIVGGVLVLVDYSGTPVVTSGTGKVKYGFRVSIDDLGVFTIPAGLSADDIVLYDKSGNELKKTKVEGGKIYYDWPITGENCWWDYEFEGNVKNAGAEGTALTWDSNRPFKDNEFVTDTASGTKSLRVPTRPWRDVSSWPATATFVMYGNMVHANNQYYIVFGSTYYGNKNAIFLATDDVEEGKVVLCQSNGHGSDATVTTLCTMTVDNAQTAKHLYAFVLSTVDGISTVSIYLDGKYLKEHTFEGSVALGPGFQIASPHGGQVQGYERPADDDSALVDWLRVYDEKLSDNVMEEYAKRYPYVSPSKAYTRTVSGEGLWSSTDAWQYIGATSVVYTNVPAKKAKAEITAVDNAILGVNLDSDVTYEMMTVNGSGSLSITNHAPYTGRMSFTGNVVADTNVLFDYRVVDLSEAVLIATNGATTVTFDVSAIDLNVDVDTSYVLARAVTLGESATLTCTYAEVPEGRSVSWGVDAKGKFVFTVALDSLKAVITDSTKFSEVVWTFGGEPCEPDWEKDKSAEIIISPIEEGTITNTFDQCMSATGDAVEFKFVGSAPLVLAADEGVAITNFTYDFSAYSGRVTFDFNPFITTNCDVKTTVKGGADVTIRYAVDIGTQYAANATAGSAGVWECSSATLVGSSKLKQGVCTVRVPTGDVVTLANDKSSSSTLSLDVCGGEVHLGVIDGATAIKYGDSTTSFAMSSGQVIASGLTNNSKENDKGLWLGSGSALKSFVISNGLFDVSTTYLNFKQKTALNVCGGLIRVKGVRYEQIGTLTATNCTFEIGSLGWDANAVTFTANAGVVLRSIASGVTMYNVVTLTGGLTMESLPGASLIMGSSSNSVKGKGTLKIAQGLVKLGKDTSLGTLPLEVADGATFDLNGCKPGNALTIIGTGTDKTGALVNNGAAISHSFTITLSGDSTIGGSGNITYTNSKLLNLSSYTLTLGGTATFAIGGGTVQGPGAIFVASGVLASNGATALGEEGTTVDLTIDKDGTLNLAGGNHISCRDFASKGKIVGNSDTTKGAVLIVNDTLDATEETSIPKLTLRDKATLNGDGLVITADLTLGATLYVTVEDTAANIKIATLPEKLGKTFETTVFVNKLSGYTLLQVDDELWVSKGGTFARILLNAVDPWVNFEELRVAGKITISGVTTPGETNVSVVAVAGDGTSITQRFAYAGANFEYCPTGLLPGEEYTVYAYVTVGDDVIVSSKRKVVMEANSIDGWFSESADTFDTVNLLGTGSWNGTGGVKSGTVIALDSAKIVFHPTNTTLAVYNSRIRDITVEASFTVGFEIGVGDKNLSGDCTEENVGVRMATNETGVCQLEIKTDGEWSVVTADGFTAESNTMYKIAMRLDAATGNVTYTLVTNWGDILLGGGEYDPIVQASNFNVLFTGTGKVKTLVGACHDVNLCSYNDKMEYSNLDAAVAAEGTDRSITPIWISTYQLNGDAGSFRVKKNDLLTISWDKWYHVAVSNNVNGLSYHWIAGNNWLDYSDAKGVTEKDGAYTVNSAEGLAWIAEQTTNEWFGGTVTLGEDIDLTSKNWTPIARFTGTFDGAGHTISGLNNTNVLINPILGEAGYYHGGITNDWGYSAYGLFGCTTNATLRNVTLKDIAIRATDDSTTALVGVHSGGDLTICNVTNESGLVEGADVVAGIVTVGGNGDDIGKVTVNGNVNYATLVGDVDANVNLAQILAGTHADTLFLDDVDATGNAGVAVPVCNFADTVSCYDDDRNYRTYVEANDEGSVPIDPMKRTARMLAQYCANGEVDIMGLWTDSITKTAEGKTLVFGVAGETIDGWSTVQVDRNLTIDLNGSCVYGVYDCDVFKVAEGKTLTLTNGVIYYAHGYNPTNGTVVLKDVKLAEIPGEGLYARTVPIQDLEVVAGKVVIEVPYSCESFYYIVDSTPTLAEDWTKNVASEAGNGSTLYIETPAAGASGFYRVRISDTLE